MEAKVYEMNKYYRETKLPSVGAEPADDEIIPLLGEFARKKLRSKLRRGDLVAVTDERDRNDGVAIWDGKEVVPLGTDIDEYGYVPPEFTVFYERRKNKFVPSKFDFDTWSKVIRHNSYVHMYLQPFAKQLKSTLRATLATDDEKADYLCDVCLSAEFEHDDTTYIIRGYVSPSVFRVAEDGEYFKSLRPREKLTFSKRCFKTLIRESTHPLPINTRPTGQILTDGDARVGEIVGYDWL